MLKFKGEMLRDIQREKYGDDGHVALQHQSSFWCVISHGCNWWKIFRRPFQNKVCFRNTPNFLRHGSISLEWGVRRGRFKSIMEYRLLPISLFSSFSLSACQATPTLLLLQAVSFLWALQIWLRWHPYAMWLQEPVKKASSVLNWQLSAGDRAGSDFFVFLTQELPHCSHHQGPWRKGCEGEEHVRKSKVLQAGQYPMFLLEYSEKEKGIFLQPPLLLPETWSQWFAGVRTTRYLLMPLKYLRSHPCDGHIYTRRTLTVSRH